METRVRGEVNGEHQRIRDGSRAALPGPVSDAGNQQTDKRGFRTKRDAELFLASLELAKARGDYVPAARAGVNFETWSEKWIDSLVQVKPSTLQGYVSITRGRLQPRWGSTPLNADLPTSTPRNTSTDSWFSIMTAPSSSTVASRSWVSAATLRMASASARPGPYQRSLHDHAAPGDNTQRIIHRQGKYVMPDATGHYPSEPAPRSINNVTGKVWANPEIAASESAADGLRSL